MTLLTWLRGKAGELARFSVVGVAGIFVNLGTFNLLRLGPLHPDVSLAGNDDRVVTAKIIATLVSIVFAWAAHRHWTFRGGSRHHPVRELALFGLVNGAAIAVEATAVAISHHGLGFTSLLADNVASLVGIGMGTVTRYAGYSRFVFAAAGDDARAGDDAQAQAGAGSGGDRAQAPFRS
ncbi:GtrA family protein [Demequina pelophila]|uniref:GtrA family protein n=1 Tax=Demequina pelophila TaxID=1638984 RepID=UPI000784DAF5|nr:GtrA family protein [Demequina pelophila]